MTHDDDAVRQALRLSKADVLRVDDLEHGRPRVSHEDGYIAEAKNHGGQREVRQKVRDGEWLGGRLHAADRKDPEQQTKDIQPADPGQKRWRRDAQEGDSGELKVEPGVLAERRNHSKWNAENDPKDESSEH